MRKLLCLISLLLFACVWQSAESYAIPHPMSDGTDSTGTGGNVPTMGWGDTANTMNLKSIQHKADTTTIYDLNGKVLINKRKSIRIKNGRCQIIKR